jgi:hypothetical protein
MRTTLTLDDDVVKLLEDEVHRVRKPFKQVVNDAIRRGLSPGRAPRVSARYRVSPHVATLSPGIDRSRLNAFADELEDSSVLAKVSRSIRAAERRSK